MSALQLHVPFSELGFVSRPAECCFKLLINLLAIIKKCIKFPKGFSQIFKIASSSNNIMNSIRTHREPALRRLTLQLEGGDDNFVWRQRISAYWHAPWNRERVPSPFCHLFSMRRAGLRWIYVDGLMQQEVNVIFLPASSAVGEANVSLLLSWNHGKMEMEIASAWSASILLSANARLAGSLDAMMTMNARAGFARVSQWTTATANVVQVMTRKPLPARLRLDLDWLGGLRGPLRVRFAKLLPPLRFPLSLLLLKPLNTFRTEWGAGQFSTKV